MSHPDIPQALADTRTKSGSSRWGESTRCPMAEDLAYRQNLERVPVPPGGRLSALDVGSAVHACLEFVHKGAKIGEQRDWREVVEFDLQQAAPRFTQQLWDEAGRLMMAYFKHWGAENAGWPEGVRITDVEREFTAHIQTDAGFQAYSSRLDLLVQLQGRYIIVDHKTRSAKVPDDLEEFRREMGLRPQFLGSSWLLKTLFKLDHWPDVWVNVMVKTKIPQFSRILVPIKEANVQLWLRSIKEIMFRATEMPVYQNLYSCVGAFSRCTYFDWCHAPEQRAQLYRIRKD